MEQVVESSLEALYDRVVVYRGTDVVAEVVTLHKEEAIDVAVASAQEVDQYTVASALLLALGVLPGVKSGLRVKWLAMAAEMAGVAAERAEADLVEPRDEDEVLPF